MKHLPALILFLVVHFSAYTQSAGIIIGEHVRLRDQPTLKGKEIGQLNTGDGYENPISLLL